jgi:hypothetical protein
MNAKNTAEDERCMTHPVVREKVQEMLDKEDKDLIQLPKDLFSADHLLITS